MATYHGYIVNWSGLKRSEFQNKGATRTELFAEKLLKIEAIQEYRDRDSNKPISEQFGWKHLVFVSNEPLLGEDIELSKTKKWSYKFLIRVNLITENIILGTQSYKVTRALRYLLNANLRPSFRNVAIHVDKLADYLLEHLGEGFAITKLTMDAPKYGAALGTVMLFGEDIAQASALRTEIIEYKARQIGLRLTSSSVESAQLGSNGYLKFYDDRLQDIEKCLGFVKELNLYVD